MQLVVIHHYLREFDFLNFTSDLSGLMLKSFSIYPKAKVIIKENLNFKFTLQIIHWNKASEK